MNSWEAASEEVDRASAFMDRMYHRQRHYYDLTRKFYLLGRDELIADLAVPPGGSVLEVGCGTGRNLIKLAQTYPDARCFGIDISLAMLDTAFHSVNRAGLGNRVRMAKADATCFDPKMLFGKAAFDRVVISYALSMIPDWKEVIRRAAQCLADGGVVQIVDFGDQSELPVWFSRTLCGWLRLFGVTPRFEMRAAVNDVTTDFNFRGRVFKCYRGYAVRAVIEKPEHELSTAHRNV